MLKVRDDVLDRYVCHAPLALALERSVESELYRRWPLKPPVMDVGCGDGLFAEMVFSGAITTGVEPDRRERLIARQRGVYDELIPAAGDAIPKPDGHFRTILSNSVLEHIPDLQPVLMEIHRLLHVDGYFFFTAPSEHFEHYSLGNALLEGLGMRRAAGRFRGFYNAFWRHYHCYSLNGWTAKVTACGFEVKDALTFNPRSSCLLNDILAPLGLPAKLTKARKGRWTLLPLARAFSMKPIAGLLRSRIARSGPCPNGGLVFMALRKTNRKVC